MWCLDDPPYISYRYWDDDSLYDWDYDDWDYDDWDCWDCCHDDWNNGDCDNDDNDVMWDFVIGSNEAPHKSRWTSQTVDKRYKNRHRNRSWSEHNAHIMGCDCCNLDNNRRKTYGKGARSCYQADLRNGRIP